jgi:hypothetical protein
MKRALPRAVRFFVTMLTAALIVVGWRVAGAGPCIRDGQTCRTNDSCCSGVCVKSSKKSFGTCCTPTTCAAVGASCGMIADGCGGTLDCGTCTLPQTCGGGGTPNVCGSTTTTTTTLPPIQCCVRSSPMGAFDTCTVETPAQCAAEGGIAQGSGTCSPNPCPPTTTATTSSTTTTLPIPTNPCASDCDGACGPDEECVYARPVCACAPAPACGGTGGGTCGGNCPVGSTGFPCHFDSDNGFCLCDAPGFCGLKGSPCTSDQACCNGLCDASAHYCTCLPPQASCTRFDQCCSGTCGTSGTCCARGGSACGADAECCSGNCEADGRCACLAPGAACLGIGNDPACCSGTCVSGICGCLSAGLSCTGNGDCCTDFCDASRHCACVAAGDPCTSFQQCCGLTCSAIFGVCCRQGGQPCTVGTECCSSVCGGGGLCDCLPRGASCVAAVQCCSLSCGPSGKCQ